MGACLRHFVSQIAVQWFGKGFPFATLAVNVLGAFALGALYAVLQQGQWPELWRSALGIGFLGALTTFSTFSLDTVLLFQQGFWLKAGLNVLLNVICCLFAVWVAMQLFKAN